MKRIVIGGILFSFLFLAIFLIYRNFFYQKYDIELGETSSLKLIYEDEKHRYYLDSLSEFKIHKKGKYYSLKEAFTLDEYLLEEILNDSKSRKTEINGTYYYYDDFTIYHCLKINEDHVMPNQDIIFGRKDFKVDFTKHCY